MVTFRTGAHASLDDCEHVFLLLEKRLVDRDKDEIAKLLLGAEVYAGKLPETFAPHVGEREGVYGVVLEGMPAFTASTQRVMLIAAPDRTGLVVEWKRPPGRGSIEVHTRDLSDDYLKRRRERPHVTLERAGFK